MILKKAPNHTQPDFPFSHPAQEDWATRDIPEEAISHIDYLYSDSKTVHAGSVLGAMAVVTQKLTERRLELEVEHMGRVLTSEAEFDEYESLIGDAVKTPQLAHFFSAKANATLDNIEVSGLKAFSGAIGGNRQYGFLHATRTTDTMGRRLPRLIQEKYNVPVSSYLKGAHALLRYTFEPYFPAVGNLDAIPEAIRKENYLRDFYGVITRRRPVADVNFDDREVRRLRIFKESVGLIVMRELPPETVGKIVEEYENIRIAKEGLKGVFGEIADSRMPLYKTFSSSRLNQAYRLNEAERLSMIIRSGAQIAGAVFENAIANPGMDSTEVLPVSAHYIMTVRNKEKGSNILSDSSVNML